MKALYYLMHGYVKSPRKSDTFPMCMCIAFAMNKAQTKSDHIHRA